MIYAGSTYTVSEIRFTVLSVLAHSATQGNENNKEGAMERIGQILWISSKPSDFECPTRLLFATKVNLTVCEPAEEQTPMFEGPNAPQLICCAFEYVLLGELTLITALRRRYPEIPIILITRRPSARGAQRTAIATGGCDTHHRKNCDPAPQPRCTPATVARRSSAI